MARERINTPTDGSGQIGGQASEEGAILQGSEEEADDK